MMKLYSVLIAAISLKLSEVNAFNFPQLIKLAKYSPTSPSVKQSTNKSLSSPNLATLPPNNDKDNSIVDLRSLKKIVEIFENGYYDVSGELSKVKFASVKDFIKLLLPEGNIKPDVKLELSNGKSFLVHRLVLSSRSKKFRELLSSSTTDTTVDSEGGLTVLKLDDDVDEQVMKELITFMYSNAFTTYADVITIRKHGPSLYYAAQKYQIPEIVDLCEAYLVGCVRGSTVLYLKDIASQYNIQRLKAATIAYINASPELVLNRYVEQLLSDEQ